MSAGNHRPIRAFIYGSCVSRDTFEFLRPFGYELIEYVARSSLVSAFSASVEGPVRDWREATPFQRQQVERDASSALPSLIQARARDTDRLLWDITDERLGFYERTDGAVITNSIDLMKTSHAALDDGYALVPFGSDHHHDAFTAALFGWRDLLEEVGLLPKLVVVAPAWAEWTGAGNPTPSSFGLEAKRANVLMVRYLASIKDVLGVDPKRIVQPAAAVRADAAHKWGVAPFHYAEEVYQDMVGRIRALDHGARSGA